MLALVLLVVVFWRQRQHLQTRGALVLPLPLPMIIVLLLPLPARGGKLLPRRRSMTLLIFLVFFKFFTFGCSASREVGSREVRRQETTTNTRTSYFYSYHTSTSTSNDTAVLVLRILLSVILTACCCCCCCCCLWYTWYLVHVYRWHSTVIAQNAVFGVTLLCQQSAVPSPFPVKLRTFEHWPARRSRLGLATAPAPCPLNHAVWCCSRGRSGHLNCCVHNTWYSYTRAACCCLFRVLQTALHGYPELQAWTRPLLDCEIYAVRVDH